MLTRKNVLGKTGDIINSFINAEIDQLHGHLSMASPSQININQIIQDTNPFVTRNLYCTCGHDTDFLDRRNNSVLFYVCQ